MDERAKEDKMREKIAEKFHRFGIMVKGEERLILGLKEVYADSIIDLLRDIIEETLLKYDEYHGNYPEHKLEGDAVKKWLIKHIL